MSKAVESTSPAFWRAQEFLLLQQVFGLLGRSLAVDVVLREMLHLLSELLGLNRGRIVLLDEPQDGRLPTHCRIRYAYGLTQEEIARGCYALGEGITGRVLSQGQLIIVQDIDSDPNFLARAVARASLPREPVSFIALPLRIEQRNVGVLACHRIRSRDRALADDVAILRILSTLAAQVLALQAAVQARTGALERQNAMLTRALETGNARYGIIGTSPVLLQAISELERVSDTTASVLLLGESGTGKELFARALHLASPRRDQPFIKVNCAAIPETLFESELFGYERGAFTGAHAPRAGWFEQASGGTIFLDEIGELPLTMQTKLLRTLQEGTIIRLGAKRELAVDVRLVAATNRELEQEVAAGRFRQDLYYRLNVIPIRLPSLAERRDDIHALVLHFLSRTNQANQRNVSLSAAAIARLEQHPWPGNIRELANLIERIVLLAGKPVLDAADLDRFLPEAPADGLPAAESPRRAPPAELGSAGLRPYAAADSHPAATLLDALARCGGNKTRAAQALGMTARQFHYRWKKLGLADGGR
ncbi:sigma-54 interaction domain-containing protein [Plasticicumulans acidivorans]|uniref:Fis family NifA subfamily transcriptional regulator n=1 Tax=Plasticicumulans acidivorans TaxID=886464 RepID=A0A317MZE1_9GAMM|nr:sigma 54-interacting transcriptional regulator [Plasticicumulans acidivorans]PWV65536.1 Fis family NifA subfamily transcriptional regulator [Plasticicumulans acidivorans]